MLNVKMLKGEMFIQGKTNEDLNKLGIPNLETYIERGSAPLSIVSQMAEMIDKPVEFLLNDEEYYKKFVKVRNEKICGIYPNIDGEKLEARAIELGWTKSIIAPLVSDYVNTYRFITYRKANRLYGYEINNLCWLLQCDVDYILDNSTEPGECNSIGLLQTELCNFKLSSDAFRFWSGSNKDLTELDISDKYFEYLCEANPYIPEVILCKIMKITGCSKEELEYKESEIQAGTVTEEATVISEVSNESMGVVVPNKIETSYSSTNRTSYIKEENKAIKEENKKLKTGYDVGYNLFQLSLNAPEILEVFAKIIELEEKDKEYIMNVVKVLLERFEN